MQSCDLYNQLNMLFSTLQLPILQLPIVDIKCSRNPKEAHICTQTYRTISTPCQRDAYTDSYPVVSVPSKDIEVGAICGGGGGDAWWECARHVSPRYLIIPIMHLEIEEATGYESDAYMQSFKCICGYYNCTRLLSRKTKRWNYW